MSTTHDVPDLSAMEDRLRAALAARADLVRPEDLAPFAPVAELRPRWRSPWVLLATAAVVLLVLGVVFQGIGSRPRSDDLAPKPDAPRLEPPEDVGRDWKAVDQSTPARLDLDGDAVEETVRFLGERTKRFDGRIRLQTTLSTTGEESYGIAELGTTIGTTALDPIDADDDGDEELVLHHDDPDAVGGGGYPLVFDLRDGLLVGAAVEDADLLVRGRVPVPGEEAEFYEMVRMHDYWVEDGRLMSSRSVGAYASSGMLLFTPEASVADAWEWHLGDDGVLRHGDPACVMKSYDSARPCGAEPVDTVVSLPVERADYVGIGETVDYTTGYGFSARLQAVADPSLVVEGPDGRTIEQAIELPQPLLGTSQPQSVFADGASVVLTSAMDPSLMAVLTQDAGRMVLMDPVGEIELTNRPDQRTWLTDAGAVLSAVKADGDTWVLWQWTMVSRTEIAALPWGTVCFDDVDEPSTVRAC